MVSQLLVKLDRQKQVDILEKKRGTNQGQVPKYYVENSHKGIIERDLFLKVQEEISLRSNLTGTNRMPIYSGNYALSGMCVADIATTSTGD